MPMRRALMMAERSGVIASITVVEPGLFTTVQDLGRDGYGRLGVSPGGAADRPALRLGNLIAGNPEGAAGLEMTLQGGVFRFEAETVVAITGSDFDPALDGRPLPLWTACEVRAGQRLSLGATRSGARSYLAVRGGIAVPRALGSTSTHVPSRLGGLQGRALRRGDLLPIGPAPSEGAGPRRRVSPTILDRLRPRKTLLITEGPQAEQFSPEARRVLTAAPWVVTEEADRMGLRLKGEPIPPLHSGRILTEGVTLGAIQIPLSGQPIILFVDQQTTGGYPVLASVITADLPSVGQLRPRDTIRFERVGLDEAVALAQEQEECLRSDGLLIP